MRQTVGSKIRDARLRKGMTQTELANGLVTPSMISQIEADKAVPSYTLLQGIAERLQTAVEFFLTDFENYAQQQSMFQLAKACIDGQVASQSFGLLNRLLQEDPLLIPHNEIQFLLAKAYMQKEEYNPAMATLETILEHALQYNDPFLAIRCYEALGTIEYQQQQYTMAIHHWNLAYRQAQASALSDPLQIGQMAQRLSQAYEKLGLHEQSQRYLLDSFTYFQSKQLDNYASTYRELAQQSHTQGEYELALEYAQKASALHKYAEFIQSFIRSQIDYAKSIQETGQTDKAMLILEECVELSSKHQNPSLQYQANVAVAHIHFVREQYELALKRAEESWKYTQEGSLEQANILFLLGRIESNLQHGKQAIERFEQAIKLYEGHRAYQNLVQAYLQLGTIWIEKNRPKVAAAYMDKMRKALELTLQERNILPSEIK